VLRRWLALLAVLALAAAACADETDDQVSPPTDAPPGTTEPPDPPDEDQGGPPGDGEAVDPVGEVSTEPRVSDGFPSSGPQAHLVDVRVASHQGLDRVVLEFEASEPPSWQVDWEEPPIVADPSGLELDVAGDAFLAVSIHPATAVDLTGPEPQETYDGPDHVVVDGSIVAEAVLRTDHHAALGWVLGLRSQAPFAVGLLEDPYRLVIDVVVDPEGATPPAS
jgi:hypothetical protein